MKLLLLKALQILINTMLTGAGIIITRLNDLPSNKVRTNGKSGHRNKKKNLKLIFISVSSVLNWVKKILINSIKEVFPSFSIKKTDAFARIFYYIHIYGGLRWNSRLDYLIDVPQFRDGLIGGLCDFASPKDKEKMDKLIHKNGLRFTIPPEGDNAPIEE